MKKFKLWFLVLIAVLISFSCDDLSDYFIVYEDDMIIVSLEDDLEFDPYRQSIINGEVKLKEKNNGDNPWLGIEPELKIEVSHGIISIPPIQTNTNAGNQITAVTAGHKVPFEWKISPPLYDKKMTIAVKIDLDKRNQLIKTEIINVAKLSPLYVHAKTSKDTLYYDVQDSINVNVELTNIYGEVGSPIEITINQESSTNNYVKVIKDGLFALDGKYMFKITNPSSGQGNVRFSVSAEGKKSEDLIVFFRDTINTQ